MYDEFGACNIRCAKCGKLLDHVCHSSSSTGDGWTAQAKTKFFYLGSLGQYRCASCGEAKQIANNEKLKKDKPFPNVPTCMMCKVVLVHAGRKNVQQWQKNCSKAQMAKGDGDRRCWECAKEHEMWHKERKAVGEHVPTEKR